MKILTSFYRVISDKHERWKIVLPAEVFIIYGGVTIVVIVITYVIVCTIAGITPVK